MSGALNGAEHFEAFEQRVPIAQEPRPAVVRVEHVDHFWPKVREWIDAAVAEAVSHELSAQELYKRCKSGEYLLLLMAIGEDLCGAAVLERSVNQKGHSYICIAAMGGIRMPEWIACMVSTCRTIGRDIGATQLLMIGRPGWKPYLLAQGAKLKCICMTLDL